MQCIHKSMAQFQEKNHIVLPLCFIWAPAYWMVCAHLRVSHPLSVHSLTCQSPVGLPSQTHPEI
jgi:hypothetical protein